METQAACVRLFPAYAGVILLCACVWLYVWPFPRIRGGDP